jgi:hypothetical protein
VDGYGNVYIVDVGTKKVVKLTPEGMKDDNVPAKDVTFSDPYTP